jgi:NAD(P)-dependent dehydrogenase (short-subunit alcohol dehydrogenase family)
MLSHYSASKWAVRGFTQAFAMEMAEHKITVNGYAPGIVGTAMWDLIDEELGKKKGLEKGETIKKYVTELTALGRTSVPEGKIYSTSIYCPINGSPRLSKISECSITDVLCRCCKDCELLS